MIILLSTSSPHFELSGNDSLDDELSNGNITRKVRKKKGTEYLSYKGCPVCEGNTRWFDYIKE
ncbi:hypothetical protein Cantr_08660 [Candida viswanathii]|uniref:Uncharacterized protein n=1 Tax=Candida viswanathii TaxID=5486 RepID=A0A367Y696_9ASCO|nr:hypothetical protein Cantr_08660 [Candida viswanathii]